MTGLPAYLPSAETTEIDDRFAITGVILAGGASRRMGRNKALLPVAGLPLIERIYRIMASLFRDVILVTNTPEDYAFLPCPMTADIYRGVGSIAGLHAGLSASPTERIFIVACDAPLLDPAVVNLLCTVEGDYDAVVPVGQRGCEPLQAIYRKSCMPALELALQRDDRKLSNLLERIRTRFVPPEELAAVPDAERSFLNLNTPEEYLALVPPAPRRAPTQQSLRNERAGRLG